MSDSMLSLASKEPGLLGYKVGMTRVFEEDGSSVPVTVIDVSNNRIAQIKSLKNDGYSAVQIAFGSRRSSRLSRSKIGHLAKAGIESSQKIKEFHVNYLAIEKFHVGDELVPGSIFSKGQYIDVTGVTIGKGFSGTIKRHNFRSQRASHGNSRSHRVPGSIGGTQDPGRVFPGKKMAGHLGCSSCTIQNLKLMRIDSERCLIYVKGAVPGCRYSHVILRSSIKKIKINAGI